MNGIPVPPVPFALRRRSFLRLALLPVLLVACDQGDYPYYMKYSRCTATSNALNCGTATASGGEGVTETEHDLGQSGGTVTFDWDADSIPDRFEVIYEGAVLFDTGSVSGSGSERIEYCGTSTSMTVRVTGPSGTAWIYTLSCPF